MNKHFETFLENLAEITQHLNVLEDVEQDLKNKFEARQDRVKELKELLDSARAQGQIPEAFELRLRELKRQDKKIGQDISKIHVNANSIFLYAYVVFGRFTFNFLKNELQVGVAKHREKYLSMYRSQFSKEIESNSLDLSRLSLQKHLQILADPKLMIERVNYLGNPVETAIKVYNAIDLGKKSVDRPLYERYQEIKERRNALTHRGTELDTVYLESLSRKLGKDSTLLSRIKDRAKGRNTGLLSCTPSYVLSSTGCLFELAARLVAASGSKESFNKSEEESQQNWLHEFMIQYFVGELEIHQKMLLKSLHVYGKTVIENFSERQIDRIDVATKVNWIILTKLFFVDVRGGSLNDVKQTSLYRKLYDVNSKRKNYIPRQVKRLLNAFMKNDSSHYFEELSNFDDEGKDDWFMTQYLTERSVRQFLYASDRRGLS